ncbi:RNA polymerase sigma factor [Sphingomonas sp. UYEF23]|uniref:RNA polymerase sigma factor n=1 Tax=Sphingomonas sp. UYEF23 TaxID=1756408 RepID=UPI003393C4D7
MRMITRPFDGGLAYGIPEDQPLPPEDRVPSGAAHAAAMDDLYRTQAPRLLRYFRRSTGSTQTAADLVHDAFARLAHSGRLPDILNPAAYLQRIARNLLVDRSRAPMARETFVPLEEWDARTSPTQEDGLLAQDLLRCYEAAIATLPERTRMVFLLHRADELTYSQIASRLEMRFCNVQYHMKQALAHLDRALDER